MGAPIYISLTSKRTYVSIVALVSEFQDNIADMVRYVFLTRLGLKYLPVHYSRFVTWTELFQLALPVKEDQFRVC